MTIETDSGDLYTLNMPTESVGNIAVLLMNLFMSAKSTEIIRAESGETSSDKHFTLIPDVHHVGKAQLIHHDSGEMDLKILTADHKDLLIVFPEGMLQDQAGSSFN